MKVRTIPRGVAKAHSCRGSVQRGIQRARVGVREPSLYRGVVRRTHYYRNSDVGHPYTFESSSAFGTQRNRGVDRVRSAAQSTETELGRKDDDNGEGERFIDIEEFDRMHGMTFEDEINSGVAGKTLDSTSSFNDGDSGLAMELSFAGLPTHSDNVEGSNSDRAINSELTNDSSIPSTTTESILSQDQSPSSASVPPMWSSRAKRKGFRNKEDMFELAFTLESKQNDEHWEDLLAGHELSGRDWVKIFPLMSEEKRGLAKTIELFDYLKNETSNDVKNVYAFTTMINCCASHLDEETINRFLVEMNELDIIPTAATYTAILKCIKDRPKRIEAMVDMMKKNGYELNLRTYTTYITSLGRRGKWQKALELFQMLKKDGHVPNQITYGAIVAALAKSNKLDMAMDIFEEMLERGLQPNVQIYTSLIHCCRFSGEWKQALELFSEMVEDDELKPDVITYTALICTCLQAGEWKESLNLYTQMKKNGVQPNERTMTAVHSAARLASEKGDVSHVKQIESDMIQMGISPSNLFDRRDRTRRQSRSGDLLDRRDLNPDVFKFHAQKLDKGRRTSRKTKYIDNRQMLPQRASERANERNREAASRRR